MSSEEQAKVLGEVMMKLKEKTELLQKLKSKAHSIGTNLEALAQNLQRFPERVIFEGVSHDARFGGERPFNQKILNTEDIIKTCQEIRGLTVEVETLERQKKGMGF